MLRWPIRIAVGTGDSIESPALLRRRGLVRRNPPKRRPETFTAAYQFQSSQHKPARLGRDATALPPRRTGRFTSLSARLGRGLLNAQAGAPREGNPPIPQVHFGDQNFGSLARVSFET